MGNNQGQAQLDKPIIFHNTLPIYRLIPSLMKFSDDLSMIKKAACEFYSQAALIINFKLHIIFKFLFSITFITSTLRLPLLPFKITNNCKFIMN